MLDGNAQGYAQPGRKIAVSPVAALPHKTLFHELGHVILGHCDEKDFSESEITPRDVREVEAEAIALLCCESLGLPGAEFSRGYIQEWGKGQATPSAPLNASSAPPTRFSALAALNRLRVMPGRGLGARPHKLRASRLQGGTTPPVPSSLSAAP